MTSNPIVALSGVTKTYGVFTALHATDLSIAEGEFVTLLGPSGCGKTTTLRLIGGFEQASSGRVTIDGKDVTQSPPYRRPVNTVFQDYALFPHMSVAENISYGLSVKSNNVAKSERDSRVAEALAMGGSKAWPTDARANCRGDSASVSPWHALSSGALACCCSMNRFRRSTSSLGKVCRAN